MNEGVYQRKLIKKLQALFPNCFILKNDPSDTQGIPDLLILFEDRWAALEVKASPTASAQVNQHYYITVLNEMSFAAFINPQNEQEVLDALQFALGAKRQARVSITQ